MELNPNHPVTDVLRGNWHVVVAVLMAKCGIPEVEITEEDIERVVSLYGQGATVAAEERGTGLHIRLVTREEGVSIAGREGGQAH